MEVAAEECKLRGNGYFENQEYEHAVEAYSEAISLQPQECIYWLNRSTAYRQLLQWANAERDATHAIDLDPTNVKAWYARVISLQHLGRLEEAIDTCETGLVLHKTNTALQQLRINLIREQNNCDANGKEAPQPFSARQGSSPSSSSSSSSGKWEQGGGPYEVSEEDRPSQQLCDLACQGDADACHGLLEAGAVRDINWRRPKDGNTALHLASEEGHVHIVKVLLAAGADPEVTNDFMLKPFALAQHGGETEQLLRRVTKPLGDERRAALRINH